MNNFADTLVNAVNSARPVVIAIVAVSLLVTGVMLIYPSERSKQTAKDGLPFIILGCAIALGAVAIAGSLNSTF